MRSVMALLVGIVLVSAASAAPPDLDTMGNEVSALFQGGRYKEALERAEPMLAESIRQHGEKSAAAGRAHYFLASVLTTLGEHARASPHFTAAIDTFSKVLGPTSPQVAIVETVYAQSLVYQARFAEAERIVKRAIASFEAAANVDQSVLARALNTLAVLYEQQQRIDDAARLMSRVVGLMEATLGREHMMTLAAVGNLAMLEQQLGKHEVAEPLYRRALAGLEASSNASDESIGIAYSNFGSFLSDQRRFDEAADYLGKAYERLVRSFGPTHQKVALALNNIADVAESRGRAGEAEEHYRRAIDVFAQSVGRDHDHYARACANFANFLLAAGRYGEAVTWYEDGARAIVARQRSQGGALGKLASDKARSEAVRAGGSLDNFVKAAWHFGQAEPQQRLRLAARAFEIVQLRQGSAVAGTIARMAARQAAGSGPLAQIVRERQDLALAWQSHDAARSAALAEPPARRKPDEERARAVEIARIDQRLTEIDRRIGAEFPEYASFANASALSIETVQRLLAENEALVLVATTESWRALPAETFVWVVTHDSLRWTVITGLGGRALAEEVDALRCGLDLAAWDGAGTERCRLLTGRDFVYADYERYIETGGVDGQLLPFDVARAARLHSRLFAAVSGSIEGKSLLFVPTGPLARLPPHVLVTAPPPSEARAHLRPDFSRVAWLGSRQPLTVLPAVSAIEALRRRVKQSRADKAYFGIANPLLDGSAARPWESISARAARQITGCARGSVRVTAALRGARRSITPLAGDGQVSTDEIRTQVPLPETADEVCAVARRLDAKDSDIRLGAAATERAVKAMSTSGDLARYRIVHFATHATLAGELKSGREPGLILTPPASASAADDGYLSAGEIAMLRLDADWVVLSACNTAASSGGPSAGAEPGHDGEALSGLARAFFYAGARALLVSHWAVDSAATVTLVTRAMSELNTSAKIGRAEALRRAMAAMAGERGSHTAHPAFWAPFVVVGEGGAARH